MRSVTYFLLSILASASVTLSVAAEENWPVPDWEPVSLEERIWSETGAASLLRFAEEQNTSALLVVRDGRIEAEHTFGEGSTTSLHPLASATKSVTSLLIGIALAEEILPAVDAPVSTWFPEAKFRDATLADLLTMRSGLPYDKKLQVGMHRSPDWLAYILEQKPVRPPGEHFRYSGFDPIFLSAILRKATGRPLDGFAKEKLFQPLGITALTWEGDEQGLINGGSQLSLSARDLARIGLLCLRGGRWQDQQVVPADWIRESTTNQVGGAPWYGYYWWKLAAETEASDPRLAGCFFASGAGGQHLILLPQLDLAIVRLGENPALQPSGQQFVPELLRQLLSIIP